MISLHTTSEAPKREPRLLFSVYLLRVVKDLVSP